MFRGAAGAVKDEDCFCMLPPTRIYERGENTFCLRKYSIFSTYTYETGASGEDTMRTSVNPAVMAPHVHVLPPARVVNTFDFTRPG